MSDLQKIRELAEAATKGPWYTGYIDERNNHAVMVSCPPSDSGLKEWPLCEIYGNNFGKSTAFDAEFIAEARTAIPLLLDKLDRCEKALGFISKYTPCREAKEVARDCFKEVFGEKE